MRLIANARALWSYREFVWVNVWRDIQARHVGSLLGAAWTVLQPLAMIVIYTTIFSNVMHARLGGSDSPFAYSIYLCAGMLPWGFFAESVSRMTGVFIENANLIKKARFPRVCLPAVALLSSGFNFLVIFGVFLAFLLIIGMFPGWMLLPMIAVLLLQVALAAGLGVLLGTLNVFFRDVGHITGLVLQFWFWLTPIVYPASILPDWARVWLRFNPMAPVVDAYQRILVHHTLPDLTSLWRTGLVALLLVGMAAALFRRHAGDMADEL